MSTIMPTLESKLVEILKTFEHEVEGVRSSAVADREGLPIVNGFMGSLDPAAITGTSALALESARKVFGYIGLKGLRSMTLDGEDAKVVICDLGGGRASFIAIVDPATNMGLLKFMMAYAAKRIEKELGFTSLLRTSVEEIFLLAKDGRLISHVSRNPVLTKDRDILAGMFTVVQSFARDAFGEGAGTLEEMEMANLRLRLISGHLCGWALIATGKTSEAYIRGAREALLAFEEKNRESLHQWNGVADSLIGIEQLFEGLLAGDPS
jgi:predicted regulator of Ras-like GTPase activity (Roadblock/LC7/MglB family)